MRKILIILLMFLLTTSSFAETKQMKSSSDIDSIVTTETVHTDDQGYMSFILTTTTYYLKALNVKVKTVEAVVLVNTTSSSYDYTKVIVEKGETQYIYNAVSDVEYFPLQMGSGKYNVSIMGSNDGRRFRLISEETFNVTLEENAVFLSASQTVNWDEESKVAVLANDLIKEAKTDQEKLEIIHTYVINHVRYDYKKAQALPKGYIPDPVSTLDEGFGICYDFASLLASMLRSVDIPTKLVKGYSSYTPVYHAWNEVLIEEDWLVVDASTDSIYVDYNVNYVLSKSVDDYVTSKVY
ncbi:MAG: transglutaminase domain-containing protein [Clostridiales bacterium]|nr:transglutaminase domain-containing protein [Clostridiales bacterium]